MCVKRGPAPELHLLARLLELSAPEDNSEIRHLGMNCGHVLRIIESNFSVSDGSDLCLFIIKLLRCYIPFRHLIILLALTRPADV